jgi:ferrous iron transport protein B
MYALGVTVAAAVAWVLSRTLLRSPPQPFVMELPPWRWPQPAVALERAREAAWSFLKNAGTLIVAVSVVVWALSNYPRSEERIAADLAGERQLIAARLADPATPPALAAELAVEQAALASPQGAATARRGAIQRQSLLGRAGRFVEPVVRPLGLDWRLGCAAIASFPAREVVLGTLAVLYNLPPGGDDDGTALERRLKAARWDGTDKPVFTLPVALSLMVFFALCAQCASTLVVIGRETQSWVWPVVTFTYMTVLAWLGAFATYQLGTWAGW